MVTSFHQRGMTFLEVLAAMALLGIGVAGLLSLQWQAQALQRGAWQGQEALFVLDELSVRMRANPDARTTYLSLLAQTLPVTPSADPCSVTACSPERRAAADVSAVAQGARRSLPAPAWRLQPCLDAAGDCLLLAWAGTRPDDGPDGQCLDTSGQVRPGARCLVMELP